MFYHLSRRGFLSAVTAAAAAPAFASEPRAFETAPTAADGGLTPNFIWGAASSAYQSEGATQADGRGVSIWDTFCRLPHRTSGGATGDVASDSYYRFKEDIVLLKDLGLKAYRFSIAWPRIFPLGRGSPNLRGIAHYRRVAEALHAAGIEPFCTLYHWDLPQALQDAGGWQNRDTAKAFADYAGYCAHELADLISNFMTMNELSTFIELGYGEGHHAPGLKLPRAQLAQARHHAVYAHGLAVQAIRASGLSTTRVGFAENLWPTTPVYDAPEHVAAARIAMVEENAKYLTVMATGRYTDHYLRDLGRDAPKFTPEELTVIASPVDFHGLNIYTPSWVRAADTPRGYALIDDPKSYPHMLSPWLTIGPETMYWTPKLATQVFGLREIYITENGASAQDTVAPDGQVYDTDRTMYLRNYLTYLQRAVAEGVPVKGYFVWSLLDNFEWADGYSKRFGITYVDFKTQKRTPKLSSHFYREVVRRNTLV